MPILPATQENIERAAEALRRGYVVAFPTETVYGLGADASNGTAVARIFEIKARPRFNPLIVHGEAADAIARYAVLSEASRKLARAFWPGSLTLVLNKREGGGLADLVSAGLDSVAVRVPEHPVARALLAAAGLPLAAPSANRSGHVSPTTAAHVEADLGGAPALILDGGAAPIGLESTVVDARGREPVLLRPGAVPRQAIEDVLGRRLAMPDSQAEVAAPGMLASHYAPRAKLRLGATYVRDGEVLLAFGPHSPTGGAQTVNLSPSGDLREAAANLFGALRALDAGGVETIAVMPIPEDGLGEAINDRLRRAAAPREPN
jgi:L-threonylcarbamoyladenylate synthase